jgi:uncharacterized membrane protein YhaH (DUF805 family)
MKSLFSLLSFKGRLSRFTYGWIVFPLLILMQTRRAVEDVVWQMSGVDPSQLTPSIIVLAIFALLLWPLLSVSTERLHDVGLSGLFAIPYVFPFLARAFRLYWIETNNAPLTASMAQTLSFITQASFLYGVLLAVLLVLLPGKRVKGPMNLDRLYHST